MNHVTLDHLCEALRTWTGIPAERLRPGGALDIDPEALRAELAEAIIGQDDAIDVAAKALTRRARLAPRAGERRPLWTALFAGPSGVGKSELAKQLAGAFFGDVERHLVQIDLSDFRDEHTVSRLVGAPPGYKGHGDGGELTNALRRTPTGVLLLDEVEKAHPAVVSQLLPLLGEGVVHDMNDGRVLDGTQFLVIMTSNLGTGRGPARPVGFGADRSEEPARQVREAIAGYFPKEILGRIDDVVVFSNLSPGAIERLWDREVEGLSTRLSAEGVEVGIEIEDAVKHLLLTTAGPRVQDEGARALRRCFDRAIADRCLQVLGGAPASGRVIIEADQSGGFRFHFHEAASRPGVEAGCPAEPRQP